MNFISKSLTIGTLLFVLTPLPALAAKQWYSLATWDVSLDNGVAYITSNSIPANCSYARAQIATDAPLMGSSTYARDIYAYVLAAWASSRTLSVVVDTAETTCLVYGAHW